MGKAKREMPGPPEGTKVISRAAFRAANLLGAAYIQAGSRFGGL